MDDVDHVVANYVEDSIDPADAPNGAPSGTHDISFYCDDIKKTVAELKRRGVEFTGEVQNGSKAKLNRAAIQGFFGDHESTICKHYSTLDAMVFDCTNRVAYVSRGPGCSSRWKTFGFDPAS